VGDAFSWIGQVVGWFGQFIPRWQIINANQGAVKFKNGSEIIPLGPGIHWWFPATSNLTIYPTARQTVDLRTQLLVTTDEKTVAVGGMVTYRVSNIEDLIGRTFDADQTVRDICGGVISEIVRDAAWPDLQTPEFQKELTRLMRKRLRPFGVHAMKATLTDCAPVLGVKLFQSTGQDVG
jgi:regulator of protease activity HflC (stomatin/prohibitin superfamily)